MKRLILFLAMGLMSLSVLFAQTNVSGTVTDGETGEALEGVAVLVKGTTVGMFTDAQGQYQLTVPVGGEILVFSYVGKATQEVPINGQTTVNVTMVADDISLDEVVVTGYGTQSKTTLTSAITKIDASEVKNVAVPTLDQALQGRIAGVAITGNSGTLGAQSNIRVRGVGSINASNQPLVVVDGVPYEGIGSRFAFGTTAGANGATNPLLGINFNDVESFEVLKDAAATAIYGARAANGVILITTKKGRAGKPRVEINYYAGVSEPTRNFDLLNGEEYAALWNQAGEGLTAQLGFPREAWRSQAFQDTFMIPLVLGADLRYTEGQQPNTDWIDEVTRRAFLQEFNASVSGGDENTNYFISGTFRDEDGFVLKTGLKRYAFKLSLQQKISDKVKIGLDLTPSRTELQRMNEDNNVSSPYTYGALFFPNIQTYDDEGNFYLGGTENGSTQFFGQPLGNIHAQTINLTTSQMLGNVFASWEIVDGLNFRTDFGFQYTQNFETYKAASFGTDGFPNGVGQAVNDQVINFNWDAYLNYTKTFGEHGIQLTLGSVFQKYDRQTIDLVGVNYPTDRLYTLDNAAEITGGGGFGTRFAFQNNFLRANYNYGGKYLLSLVASYNGSSRFGEEARYGFFPAVSAGWIISNEDFLAGSSAISFLKLRASWGITGNAEIGNFASRGLAGFGRNYGDLPGYELSALANSELTWERNEQIDMAIEFGFIDNRIRGSFGYYIKNTNDLLFQVPLPLVTGIATSGSQTGQNNPNVSQNIGRLRNQGIEAELTVDILRGGPFEWTIGGNIATLQNEVLELPDNDNNGEADDIIVGRSIVRVGEAIGSFYLVEYGGVDQNNGDALFYARDAEGNRDGDPTNAYSLSNRYIAGSPLPDFYGGFTNTFRFFGVELSAFFQYSVGNEIYRNEGRFVQNNLSSLWNQTRDQLNAWTPTNTDTDVPEARLFTLNGGQHSTRYLEDASYLRLKTLTLGYTFPKSLLPTVDLRIFAQAQNLITITGYEGLDPEASGQGAGDFRSGDVFFTRPQSRVITGGVNLGF